jgi:hypothetical protein
MWLQLILSMLGLGLIDALNPYTVAVLLILLPLTCAGLSIAGLAWWTFHWYQNVRMAGALPDLARKPKVLTSPWFILVFS